jgi:hypothetical protein
VDGIRGTLAWIGTEVKKVGGRACKPDSVPHANRKTACARGDHSSSPGIATGIQRPTRGFSIYDGLRLRGRSAFIFHERSLSEPGRLSPPIWPCTTRGFPCPRCCHRSGRLLPHLFTLAKRCGHFEDVSQVSLCDATALHSAGGLFSVALSVAPRVAQALAGAPHCAPWRYQARCPVKSSAPHKVKSVPQDGVRTFLPPQPCSDGFTPPLLRRDQRSPGPPATYIIHRRTQLVCTCSRRE